MFKRNSFKKLKLQLFHAPENVEYQAVPLGIIGFIGFAIYYLIWHNVSLQAYESMPLRLIAIALCLGLALKNYWPQKLRPFLSAYWYFTIFYIMPFFFTFMLLKNNFSNIWLQNSMTALFFMILLINWVELIILLIAGVICGFIGYWLTTTTISMPNNIGGIISAYLAVLGVGIIFVYNNERLQRAKFQTMQSLSASIAHELRTPLRAISSSASGIKKCLPQLIESYEIAKNENVQLPYLSPPLYKALIPAFDSIELEAQSAFTFIDMLLIKVNESELNSIQVETCNIKTCVDEALNRYPFSPEEKGLIQWNQADDFIFKGNQLLMLHVLFNLIKNALYHLKAAGKGNISIWAEKELNNNCLHFKDTGEGISAKDLPYIFDRFFTTTRHGTGIGLAFCKLVMKSIGGDITCQSLEGEYAEFVLKFPLEAMNK